MKIFKNFDWSVKSIAKVIGAVLAGIVALSIVIALVSFSYKTVSNLGQSVYYSLQDGKGLVPSYDKAMEESAYGMGGGGDFASARMIAPTSSYYPYPEPGFSTGDDAEEYEVKSYDGTIETASLDKTCDKIAALKGKDYVIFENSNKNDEYCYYSFKVVKANEEEIVKVIEDLKPKTFNANIQSIKKNVEGIDKELEILNDQLKSVEETLKSTQSAYDEITQLATNQKDAATLAQIIDSKLNLIQRLTNERLNIKAQIDRYNNSRISQTDQLEYTFFNINVYKKVIFDWKNLKDSWQFEAQQLVNNVNGIFQGISLGLVYTLLYLVMIVLYIFIGVFVLKFVWKGVKKIWKGELGKKKRR